MHKTTLITFMTAMLAAASSFAAEPASEATRAAQQQVLEQLPFEDRTDFELAARGFLAAPDQLVVRSADGTPIWDLGQYEFLSGDAPDTVNPSLWRQALLNMNHGLFEVVDGIYQVRGYDLANMTLVRGDTGWIVIDPLTARETAEAAMELVNGHFGKRPVVAVIVTHSHADHFGGVRAITDEEDLASGAIELIAPEGFVEYAVSENVIAGNAMSRRAGYMYGNILPKAVDGTVDAGLGKTVAFGTIGLLKPTREISSTGERMTVDGVEIVFQSTPGAEAPAEMMFYFPQFKALCVAEEASAVQHNLYTLRGARVRDPLLWSKYLNESIELFGDELELVFGSHHWPRWGREEGIEFLARQRDMYRYIHDQTVRLMNNGYTPREIAEELELPASLGNSFYNRDYYGTVRHNSKAVYQRYLGWFDGVPANLNPLPPVAAGRKYVDLAGGSEALLAKARESFAAGEFRWTAELVNHLVFADPDNRPARELLADAYEQLGYQAESAPWRNFYLSGASELRDGVQRLAQANTASPDIIAAIPTELFLDYMAVRLKPEGTEGLQTTINMDFTDTGEQFVLSLENSVLNNTPGRLAEDAAATLRMSRTLFNAIALKQTTLEEAIGGGQAVLAGDPNAVMGIFGRLEDFEYWFNIVTP